MYQRKERKFVTEGTEPDNIQKSPFLLNKLRTPSRHKITYIFVFHIEITRHIRHHNFRITKSNFASLNQLKTSLLRLIKYFIRLTLVVKFNITVHGHLNPD